jgi:hypothetical protein
LSMPRGVYSGLKVEYLTYIQIATTTPLPSKSMDRALSLGTLTS